MTDISLQTMFLSLNFSSYNTEQPFDSVGNTSVLDTLITMGDVTNPSTI